jgi:hypothetical protein
MNQFMLEQDLAAGEVATNSLVAITAQLDLTMTALKSMLLQELLQAHTLSTDWQTNDKANSYR